MPTQEDLSIISLILDASIVVQLILFLLVSLSVGSWSIIFRKGLALGAVRKETEAFEKDFWSGGGFKYPTRSCTA